MNTKLEDFYKECESKRRFYLQALQDYKDYKAYLKERTEAEIDEKEDQITAYERILPEDRLELLGGIVDAFPHEFPWIVRIGRSRDDISGNFCAGVLINPYYVITAAQNVAHWLYQDIYVGLGIHNLNSFQDKSEGCKIPVNKMIVNRECAMAAKTQITHDIALIELAKPAKIGAEYNIATLDLPKKYTKYKKNTGWVAGWGTSSLENIMKPNPTLRKVAIQLMDRKLCNEHLKNHNFLSNSLIGVEDTRGIDFCANIGSPIIVKNEDGAFELAGIITFGRICRCLKVECQFGYYVSIPYLLDWIIQNIKK